MNLILKVGVIGATISLIVLAISLILPTMSPGVSWEEAKLGYIPAGLAFLGFQMLVFIAAYKPSTAAAAMPSQGGVSNGRAIAYVVAIAIAIGGLVGAGFSFIQAYECHRIGVNLEERLPLLQTELETLITSGADEDSDAVRDVKDKIESSQFEWYYDDASYFAGWGVACVVAAMGAIGWLIWSCRRRRT